MVIAAILGLVGFVVLTWVSYRYPVWGIGVLGFVAPLEQVSFYKGITWKPFLLVFPCVFLGLLLRQVKGLDPRPQLNIVDKTLMILTIVNFLSAVTATDPVKSIRMTVQFAVLYLICSMSIHVLKTENDRRKVLFCVFLSGGVVVFYGLFQLAGSVVGLNTHILLQIMPKNPTIPYMMTIPGAVYFEGLGRHVVRVSSTFFDWNLFAGYLIALASSAWFFYCRRKNDRGRRSHLVLILILTALLLLFSFSRSGWIGAVAAGLVGYWFSRSVFSASRRRVVVGATLAIVVVGCVIPQSPLNLAVKRLNYMFEGDPSIDKHTIYGEKALEMFYRSPILGVGLHNYSEYYEKVFDPDDHGTTSHSTFLAYLAETGFLGAVVNVFFHLLCITLLFQAMRRTEFLSFPYALMGGVLTGYLGILACNLFYFFNNQAFIWTFLGLGLAEAFRRLGPVPVVLTQTTGSTNQAEKALHSV